MILDTALPYVRIQLRLLHANNSKILWSVAWRRLIIATKNYGINFLK